jgi:hypothetical protein
MNAGDRRETGFWRRLGRNTRRVVDLFDTLEFFVFVLRIVTAPFRFVAKVLDVFW